jgi:hypothetical protein
MVQRRYDDARIDAGRLAHPFAPTSPLPEEFRVRYLRLLSIVMTVAGVALAVAANVFDLGGAVVLTGLMLVVAGLVKIVTVAVWNGFAGMGPVKTTEDA